MNFAGELPMQINSRTINLSGWAFRCVVQEDITMGGNCCRYGRQKMFVRDYPMVIPYRSVSSDSSVYPVSVSSK